MRINVWIILSFFLYFCGNVHGKCECGKAEYSSNARIYNGKTAFEKQFPWQMLIQVTYNNDMGEERNPRAGGILISRKHVLSVAHAFYHEKDGSR